MTPNDLNRLAVWAAERFMTLNDLTWEALEEEVEHDQGLPDDPNNFFYRRKYDRLMLSGETFTMEVDFGNIARGPHVSVAFIPETQGDEKPPSITIDVIYGHTGMWDGYVKEFGAIVEPLELSPEEFARTCGVEAEKIATLCCVLLGKDGTRTPTTDLGWPLP